MDKEELKRRTKRFALRIFTLIGALPDGAIGWAMGKQLARCGTAVGANCRAGCRGRSTPEFISKIGTVEEEADGCCWWLELIIEGALLPAARVQPLLDEAGGLTAIFTASGRTAKENRDEN